jgi:hypothetical protein
MIFGKYAHDNLLPVINYNLFFDGWKESPCMDPKNHKENNDFRLDRVFVIWYDPFCSKAEACPSLTLCGSRCRVKALFRYGNRLF